MPLFLLIRHGENEFVKKGRMAGRLPGVHLNEKGRSQAQSVADALAARLAEAPVKAVYSSPLERTMETAEPIARALKLDVTACEGLMEVNIGEWQGKTVKGLSRLKIWRQVQRNPSVFRFPGGESFDDAQHRAIEAVINIMQKHDPKDVVICVSHADIIKLIVAYFIGLPLDFFQRLGVSPASLTAIYIGESGGSLMSLNQELFASPPK